MLVNPIRSFENHDIIKENSLPLLTTPRRHVVTPAGKKLKTMTLNASIFSQAVAIIQQREISLSKMFSFEFHWFAPAISNFGEFYLPRNKSSLVNFILGKHYFHCFERIEFNQNHVMSFHMSCHVI